MIKKNIALIGFMGCGKSSVSDYFEKKFGMKKVDTDLYIEETQGMKIKEIFEKFGEEYFRKLETDAIKILSMEENTVVSCGGGLALRSENVSVLKKNSATVLLTASPETIFSRVRDSSERPILNGNMNLPFIKGLMEKRRPFYEEAADYIVETDGKTIPEIAREILILVPEE